MGFKTIRDRTYAKLHQNTEYFAEEAVHRADVQEPWSPITVHVHWIAQEESDESLEEFEQIHVRLDRSDFAVDPVRGHLLKLDCEKDSSARPFQFTGEILQKYTHKMRLVFARPRLRQQRAN